MNFLDKGDLLFPGGGPAPKSFHLAAFYGFFLGALIFTGYVNNAFICLFVTCSNYTLGNHGEIWQMWHAVGCSFLGSVNLLVAIDSDSSAFTKKGRAHLSYATSAIYLTWGVQNTYYCIAYAGTLFTPGMWLNAIGCLVVGFFSLYTGLKLGGKLN